MKQVSFFRETISLKVLMYLYENKDVYTTLLSNQLKIPDSQIRIEVDNLSREGFIKKVKSNSSNKRIAILKLTPLAISVVILIKKLQKLMT